MLKNRRVFMDMPSEPSLVNMDYFRGKTINILVTSLAAKVPLIKSLQKANLKLANSGKIFGADMNPNCIGRYFVDEFWQMPRLSEECVNELISYCSENNITGIIPTRDGELLFFAKYKEKLQQDGIHVMVSDYNAVNTCLDKLAFFEELNRWDLSVIRTVQKIDQLSCNSYVVKEQFGAGSRSMGLNLFKKQAIEHAKTLEKPIFQEYISGQEMSIDLYVDQHGKTKGAVVRKRENVINGESQITTTVPNTRLEQLCSQAAERLKLYGHIVVQVLIDSNSDFHIIECNSRFGGASSLSLEVGLESFNWFLLEMLGADLREYPFVRSTVEKKQIRYAEDKIISV